MESIGKKLKRIRLGMGFSQSDIAKRMNVSRRTISNWEREVNLPQDICREKLNKILDNFETIIGDSDKI